MRLIRPRVDRYTVPVHAAHPVSVGMAAALGQLYGRGIDGRAGTVRYGAPTIGVLKHYTGYVFPPQLFVGWNPRHVAGGAVRPTLGGLPGSQAPAGNPSPLLAATMTVTAMRAGPGIGG